VGERAPRKALTTHIACLCSSQAAATAADSKASQPPPPVFDLQVRRFEQLGQTIA
jgi:hypothetical protein